MLHYSLCRIIGYGTEGDVYLASSLFKNSNVNTSHLAIFSSNWSNTGNAGVFYLHVNLAASDSNTNIGSRLMSNL